MVPLTGVKVTWDWRSQKSSSPVTQTKEAHDPLKTPILVSKNEPHRLSVVDKPSPAKLYHTPGAVFNVVTQVPTASGLALAVLAAMVWPQAIGIAAEQRSLAGVGGGGGGGSVMSTVKAAQVGVGQVSTIK